LHAIQASIKLVFYMRPKRTRRLILLVFAVVAVGLVAVAVLALRNIGKLQEKYIGALAQDLITTTNSPRLLYIQPEVKARLAELLAAPTRIAAIEHGDLPEPIGDGRAMHHLVLTNEQGKQLGLRLRPVKSDKLEIVGFWIPK
jgi:hypothetical protein